MLALYPDEMVVLYDGCPIGLVAVTRRLPRKFFGQFIPGTKFEVCRSAFEEAARWSRQFDETPSNEPVDYLAWDRWIKAVQNITDRIALPELPMGIEEFAVDHDLKVEVTFVRTIAERADIIGCARGLPPDLSTNKDHLEGFGRWGGQMCFGGNQWLARFVAPVSNAPDNM